jgi:hypothetical protein
MTVVEPAYFQAKTVGAQVEGREESTVLHVWLIFVRSIAPGAG